MEAITVVLCLGWIAYLLYEKKKLEGQKKSFLYMIHVNGIRGKSTVSRLIDAGLRAGAYRVFTKTTGTSPRVINVKGEEKEVLRRGKANIREQVRAIEWAYEERAEVLILECMAVNPGYQFICENSIINSNIGVISNVRRDHLDEMGESLEEIAESLSNTIPENGIFFTSDREYFPTFEKKCNQRKTKAFLAEEEREEYWEIDFPANVALALEVCMSIGISKEIALSGMSEYKRDPGSLKTILYQNRKQQAIYFVNAMAANDPDSTEMILERVLQKAYAKNKRYLLVNNRGDRMSRTKQYLAFVKKHEATFDKILLYGEHKDFFRKYLQKEKLTEEKIVQMKDVTYLEEIQEESFILAVGNICGHGRDLIDFLERSGEEVKDA